MLKKVVILSVIIFSINSFATGVNVDKNNILFEKNDNLSIEINYQDYSSFSKLREDIGQKELEKIGVFEKNRSDFDILSRVGDVINEMGIRKDVDIWLKSQKNISNHEQESLRKFAETLQAMLYLKPSELIKFNTIAFLNTNLLSESICIMKESNSSTERNKNFSLLKEVESLTLNNDERREHYKKYEEITQYAIKIDETFIPKVFITAYELCFERKPTNEELKEVVKMIENLK